MGTHAICEYEAFITVAVAGAAKIGDRSTPSTVSSISGASDGAAGESVRRAV